MKIFKPKILILAVALILSLSQFSIASAQEEAEQTQVAPQGEVLPSGPTDAPKAKVDRDSEHSGWREHRRHFGREGGHGYPFFILPVAILFFVLLFVMGGHFFRERTEQRRIELINAMLAKGQTVPDHLLTQLMANGHRHPMMRHPYNPARALRKGISLLFIGSCFLIVYFTGENDHKAMLIIGIVMLGIAIGNLFSMKAQEKYSQSQPRNNAE